MESLIDRLRKRAAIRRSIESGKSVAAGEPDRIADLLEEAATELVRIEKALVQARREASDLRFRYESILGTL